MISVCIPTYEQSGYGVHYLRQLLDSTVVQRDAEFEVVVSDNSRNDAIRKLCQEFTAPGTHSLAVRYVRNLERVGVSNNTNNAIAHAASDRIKIMYQDDLFIHPLALHLCELALERKPWVVASYFSLDRQSRRGRRHDPFWHEEMLTGKNTIGMPSVLSIRRNHFTFDPKLRTRLDCEYYWLLYREFGPPEFVRVPLVGLRYWEGSISRIQGPCTQQEYGYLRSKHLETAAKV